MLDLYNSHLLKHIVSQHCTFSISENSAHYDVCTLNLRRL